MRWIQMSRLVLWNASYSLCCAHSNWNFYCFWKKSSLLYLVFRWLFSLSVWCSHWLGMRFLLGFGGGRRKGGIASCIVSGHREINPVFIGSLEAGEASQVSVSIFSKIFCSSSISGTFSFTEWSLILSCITQVINLYGGKPLLQSSKEVASAT